MVIDRITFVGDFAKHINTKNEHGEHDYDAMLPVLSAGARRSFARYPYRYQIVTEQGVTISLADRKANVPPVRIDFNPQTADYKPILEPFSGCLSNLRVTRLDYAHDYDLDLSRVKFQLQNSVKSCQFLSRTGKLETLYLGSTQSQQRFRIYDKAKEQGEDGVKWRVEAQMRFKPDDDWWYTLPFENLLMTRPEYDSLKIQERAMLLYLDQNPQGWGELSEGAKRKYKLLGQTETCQFLHPHSIYMNECISLKKTVADILNLTSSKPLYI